MRAKNLQRHVSDRGDILMRRVIACYASSYLSTRHRSIVIYIPSKKNISADTPSLLVVTLSQPSGALRENTAATLASFLPFRKWRGHATVLPVSATHPLRPTDNSLGVLGFPVDCRQEWASFGGHNAFTTLLLQVGRRKGEPPILGGVVYRDYVRGIAIHRTKGRAVLSFCVFISVPVQPTCLRYELLLG